MRPIHSKLRLHPQSYLKLTVLSIYLLKIERNIFRLTQNCLVRRRLMSKFLTDIHSKRSMSKFLNWPSLSGMKKDLLSVFNPKSSRVRGHESSSPLNFNLQEDTRISNLKSRKFDRATLKRNPRPVIYFNFFQADESIAHKVRLPYFYSRCRRSNSC